MSSSQRYLNKENSYSHEGNLMLDLKMGQLCNLIETAVETCEMCGIRKKNHYCIEPKCLQKELVCS